nr:DUF1990 family protein [Leucobacter exalbidus]
MPVAYAAVGASKLPDITRFPPAGATPYEESVRLGSGQPRFLTASSHLMTWGAQRGAGVTVEELGGADSDTYTGPEFGVDGTPEAPVEREEHFAPDGTPFIAAGARARITRPGATPRDVLVIYTINEPRRAGFAWGTSDAEGAIGEQLFLVEHREDDSVWAVGRGFLAPAKVGLFGRKGRSDLQVAIDTVTSQLEALLPGAAPEAS